MGTALGAGLGATRFFTVSLTVVPFFTCVPALGEDAVTVQLLFTMTHLDHFHFRPTVFSAFVAALPLMPATRGTTTVPFDAVCPALTVSCVALADSAVGAATTAVAIATVTRAARINGLKRKRIPSMGVGTDTSLPGPRTSREPSCKGHDQAE